VVVMVTPIPINRDTPDRQRRGSDSSSGSGGFRDAIGPEMSGRGGSDVKGLDLGLGLDRLVL
jgi:hypothetical protein